MRSSRRISAANRRNSIAGRWRPWLWEKDTLPDDIGAQDAAEDLAPDAVSREQIPLWADDVAALGPSVHLRLE